MFEEGACGASVAGGVGFWSVEGAPGAVGGVVGVVDWANAGALTIKTAAPARMALRVIGVSLWVDDSTPTGRLAGLFRYREINHDYLLICSREVVVTI
jgi:hypothetical protein